MTIECSWCGEKMGEKEPLENKETTGTICPACQVKEARKRLLDLFLEDYCLACLKHNLILLSNFEQQDHPIVMNFHTPETLERQITAIREQGIVDFGV